MGYRAWNSYEEADAAERRKLPLRQRYAWRRIGVAVLLLICLSMLILLRQGL